MAIPSYLAKFFRSQFKTIPEFPNSFSKQTVIVTGSNTGKPARLGLEAARHIAHQGAAKVILAVRDTTKGETARQDIVANGAGETAVEVWQLDMASPDSIKAFTQRASKLDRLDAACLNAGMASREWRTFDGVEATVATNLAGTMLLACLLLPILQASARETGLSGRLSFVGSDVVFVADLRELETEGSFWGKLNDEADSREWMWQRYTMTKILLTFSCKRLAEAFPVDDEKSKVIINIMTPGFCRSTIMRDVNSYVGQLALGLAYSTIGRTTATGGRLLAQAIGPNVGKEAHGEFLMDGEVTQIGPNVESDNAKRVAAKWNAELRTKLEEMAPGCTTIEGRQF